MHLVYPSGPSLSTPQAIGRNLEERLRKEFRVVQHDWDEISPIEPEASSALLGHPHPAPWTIFRRSARKPGWARIIALSPFSHDLGRVSFLDSTLDQCDLYLAITGNFWFESLPDSPFSHWTPKMVHVDLAVDRRDFPVVKTAFNPPGSRRFLYIGHTGRYKNTSYLAQIAKHADDCPIAWIGPGKPIPGVQQLGPRDFGSEEGRRVVGEHDFLLTVGRADPNPTTILEAMAWGLVPICTPTSGYANHNGIINVPLDDAPAAADVLRRLQRVPENELTGIQQGNWDALDSHFNWERFSGQVIDAIRSPQRPSLLPRGLGRWALLRASSIASPLWRLRLKSLGAVLRSAPDRSS